MNKKIFLFLLFCVGLVGLYFGHKFFLKKPEITISSYGNCDRQECIDIFYDDFYWLTDGFDRETYDFGNQLDTKKPSNPEAQNELEFFVAHMNGKVVGFSTITEEKHGDETIGRLLFLCVKKDSRRFGIGSMLMKYSLDELEKRGHKNVFLAARSCNSRATALYEKFGFIRVTDFDTEDSNSTFFIKQF